MTFTFLHAELACAALLCGAAGAATDLHSRRIPNLLTGPAMLLGLLLHLAAGGWREAAWSLAALLVCGAVFLIFHLAGGMGAGDVKLIAAQGCLLGWPAVVPLLAFTALAGGVLALAMAAMYGRLRQTAFNVASLVVHHSRHGLAHHPELHVRNQQTLRLPYGVAIAVGTALALYMEIPT
jgi:prepilin peptidase CpaA